MVVKQERTGKIKWMKELREREWHPYIKDLLRQNISKDEIRTSLNLDLKRFDIIDQDLRMFCSLAKKNYEPKHPDLYLTWGRERCDNPRCGTCQGKYPWHYPYPETIQKGKLFREGGRGKKISVKRPLLRKFLIEECDFMPTQVDAMLDEIDLRHLILRRYYYRVEELKNLGLV